MWREWWERVSRVGAGSSAGFFVAVVIAMSLVPPVSLFTGGVAIAVHPEDLVACEQLGLLALREPKNDEFALFAAREGDKRVPDGTLHFEAR